jgi:hypothetical protein
VNSELQHQHSVGGFSDIFATILNMKGKLIF